MDLALDPGQAGVEGGGHVARVQVPPFALGGVVVDGTPSFAPGTEQLDAALMVDEDVDPLRVLQPHLEHTI